MQVVFILVQHVNNDAYRIQNQKLYEDQQIIILMFKAYFIDGHNKAKCRDCVQEDFKKFMFCN